MSNNSQPTFSVVVPTYNRPETLVETLESILAGNEMPHEVLVVDDGDLSSDVYEDFHARFVQKGVSFVYHKKDHTKVRRGLSESKNIAATIATGDVVCFMDDDVVLEPDYMGELMQVWKENWQDTKLVGVGGKAINGRRISWIEHVYRMVFGLTGECAWDVNDVAFQVWDPGVKIIQRAYYLEGCSSSYRRSSLRATPFAVFRGGRTALEDVEHCLRLKREGYHFLYAPNVRLVHHHAPTSRDAAFAGGQKEMRNRQEIFDTLCEHDIRHRAWFVWASIGWILKKILAFKFREASGMITWLIFKKRDEI